MCPRYTRYLIITILITLTEIAPPREIADQTISDTGMNRTQAGVIAGCIIAAIFIVISVVIVIMLNMHKNKDNDRANAGTLIEGGKSKERKVTFGSSM